MTSLPLGYIPANLNDLTPDWLTAALKMSGVLSSGSVEHINVAIGAKWHIAQTASVSVTYTSENNLAAPARVFIKLATFNDPLETVLPGENAFYRRGNPARLPIPACYGAFFDQKTCLSCLILQDLSETHEATPWPRQLSLPKCSITPSRRWR